MFVKKHFPRVLLLLTVILGLFVVSLLVTAATEQDVDRLKVGMTKDDVRQIMSKPDNESNQKTGDLCSRWTYKKVGKYRLVVLWFDCQQKLATIDKAD